MINSILAKNYKSLQDTKIPLGPLTVLVGANASGKSNIIGALALLKTLVTGNITVADALKPHGGYRSIVWGGDSTRDIGISVLWAKRNQIEKERRQYWIKLGMKDDYCVIKEEGFGNLVFRDTPNKWRYGSSSGSINDNLSAVNTVAEIRKSDEMSSMREWQFYRLTPHLMRDAQKIMQVYRLAENGSNLSSVIHTLFSDESPSFQDIAEFLKRAIPVVERLLSPITPDGLTYTAVKERDVPSPVASWNLSDGTLFTIALATALMSPKPPTLLVLESPDIELHPYLMEYMADLIVSACEKTQIIVTTHSPYLLDHLPSESLVIVEKMGGKTHVKPVKGKRGVKEAIRLLGPGKAWHSGYLGGVP
jgi:predicted ATPase